MRILFDHSTPFPLIRHFQAHQVETAYQRGWATLKNGALLTAAEAEGFDVFLTSDQRLQHEQNLTRRRIAIVVIGTNLWPLIKPDPLPIVAAVEAARPGTLSVGPYSHPKPPNPAPC